MDIFALGAAIAVQWPCEDPREQMSERPPMWRASFQRSYESTDCVIDCKFNDPEPRRWRGSALADTPRCVREVTSASPRGTWSGLRLRLTRTDK